MSDGRRLKRGPYTYTEGNLEDIRFASSGDVDRSFTVLIADHADDRMADGARAGIVVLDNDNSCVVFDGLYSDLPVKSVQVMFRFADIVSLPWDAFAEACRTNPRYGGGISDIDTPAELPGPGNLDRQSALGLAAILDARSPYIRALSEDPEVPYAFPPMDREGMASEICRHLMYVDPQGPWSHIAWDIRMNMGWNRTGRMRGLPPMDSGHDADWRHTVENDPDVVRNACAEALSVYVDAPTSILDMEEFPCEFAVAGRNGGFLILKKFCGLHMGATRDVSIADRILKLNDDRLEALWVACRVLDEDLSPENRRRDMEYQMHLARRAFEQGTLTSA